MWWKCEQKLLKHLCKCENKILLVAEVHKIFFRVITFLSPNRQKNIYLYLYLFLLEAAKIKK